MKLSKEAKQMAKDLGLSELDAYVMDLKSKLYAKCAKLIRESDMTHEQIAKAVGTSRARISRIASMGEHSISLEILIKLQLYLNESMNFKITA